MMSVVNCIATEHNIWLVLLAVIVCGAGSAVTIRLYRRATWTDGSQRYGWQFLTAVTAGASIWSTHFIAMLGYRPDVPVTFDPVLTAVSLLIAIFGSGIGLFLAMSGFSRFAPAIGGALLGLAVSAMHYTGMFAYRVIGLVEWDQSYILASILLAVLFSGASIDVAQRASMPAGRYAAVGLLMIAIVSLHFTAMTAFHVIPLGIQQSVMEMAAFQAMALSIAVVGLIIVGTGITSYLIDNRTRADSDEQLRHMALHDPLTGLPNRTSYNDQLDRLVAARDGLTHRIAVIGIDLDRFKEINDVWGHSAGDTALCILAERLRSLTTEGDYIARLDGDEFAALKIFQDDAELHSFLEEAERLVRKPIEIDGLDTAVGASIGVAVYPRDGVTGEVLIKNADMAMYRAKTDPVQSICFYDTRMGEAIRSRRALAEDLRLAIERSELEVHYQVQTSLSDGAIRGYEALLRWTHPERGPISPSEFIPLAEANGLILTLGEWVLRRACRDAAGWEPAYKIGVNLSAVQFAHADLSKMVHEVLLETGLEPRRLELELTETALIKDKMRSLHFVRQINALGVNVALDDFGAGYSSLDTLRTFPFDRIKLDRSFLDGLERGPQSIAIIRAVMALGKSLGICVLAEGIETQEQLAVLKREACDEAQGFLLGHPVPLSGLADHGGPVALARAEADGSQEGASAETQDRRSRRSRKHTQLFNLKTA